MHRWVWALLLLLLAGCSPLLGAAAWPAFLGVALLAGVGLFLSSASATPKGSAATAEATGAIAPEPCDGWEHKSCGADGQIQKSCCPKGARCNYRSQPFTECGGDRCVLGHDPGMCPPPKPMMSAAKTQAECKERWEPACVGNTVTPSCIMTVPTNYMGPARNPRFLTCGDDRCTTSNFIEDCYPQKTGAMSVCASGWTKVCLLGRITERCIPPGAQQTAASKGFVECAAPGTCAIGAEKGVCR